MSLILKSQKESMALAAIAREWLEIENTKREWRGVPRLAHHKLKEIIDTKRDAAKQINVATELYSEEPPPTVTAEPPPTPPDGGVSVMTNGLP
jgi:hypothetical protein